MGGLERKYTEVVRADRERHDRYELPEIIRRE